MNKTNIVLIIILVAIIIFLAILTFKTPLLNQSTQNTVETTDVCATPQGEDPVKWKEHLSHHPDLYGNCLK